MMSSISEIEISFVKTFSKVTGIPYEMLVKKLLSNKEDNTYPYWLFNSKKPEGNEVLLSPAEQVFVKYVSKMRIEEFYGKESDDNCEFLETNGLAIELVYAKKNNKYPTNQFMVTDSSGFGEISITGNYK